MNRRHFLATSLPLILSGSAAAAQLPSQPSPKRIRIEVSLLKPTLTLGETNSHTIVVVTEEAAAVDAAFIQMYSYHENAVDHTVTSQAFGPRLTVTPHLEAEGRITLRGKVQFEEAVSSAAPNEPLPVNSTSTAFTRTVINGKPTLLGGAVIRGVLQQIELTATVLGPLPAA